MILANVGASPMSYSTIVSARALKRIQSTTRPCVSFILTILITNLASSVKPFMIRLDSTTKGKLKQSQHESHCHWVISVMSLRAIPWKLSRTVPWKHLHLILCQYHRLKTAATFSLHAFADWPTCRLPRALFHSVISILKCTSSAIRASNTGRVL